MILAIIILSLFALIVVFAVMCACIVAGGISEQEDRLYDDDPGYGRGHESRIDDDEDSEGMAMIQRELDGY